MELGQDCLSRLKEKTYPFYGLCIRCNRYYASWATLPCGHNLWCNGCKNWLDNILDGAPQYCVYCDERVMQFEHREEEFPLLNRVYQLANL